MTLDRTLCNAYPPIAFGYRPCKRPAGHDGDHSNITGTSWPRLTLPGVVMPAPAPLAVEHYEAAGYVYEIHRRPGAAVYPYRVVCPDGTTLHVGTRGAAVSEIRQHALKAPRHRLPVTLHRSLDLDPDVRHAERYVNADGRPCPACSPTGYATVARHRAELADA